MWNSDPEGGQGCFSGVEGVVWNAEHAGDLTSLAIPENQAEGANDPLTTLINTRILPLYHRLVTGRTNSSHQHGEGRRVTIPDAFTDAKTQCPIVYRYSDRRITQGVDACSTVLASMVPALSSLALYFINRQGARIAAMVVFTFFFSLVIMLVTPAKRIETFVATAAFAAVLIVFVGGTEAEGAY